MRLRLGQLEQAETLYRRAHAEGERAGDLVDAVAPGDREIALPGGAVADFLDPVITGFDGRGLRVDARGLQVSGGTASLSPILSASSSLLTPALAERPLEIGDCTGVGEQPLHDLARSGAFTPFTSLFNVTGQPAISVPIVFGEDNLPTNVQIVGKPLGEDTLLQVAAQMETALGRPAQVPAL